MNRRGDLSRGFYQVCTSEGKRFIRCSCIIWFGFAFYKGQPAVFRPALTFCHRPDCSSPDHITPEMGSMRAYTVLLWLLVLLVTVATGSVPLYMRDKPRTIRGFKNHALSTARGFGKRADSEMISPDIPQISDGNSFPADWFADELQSNGELARLIVHKFIDSNQDGELSADELLRPLFEKPQAAAYK